MIIMPAMRGLLKKTSSSVVLPDIWLKFNAPAGCSSPSHFLENSGSGSYPSGFISEETNCASYVTVNSPYTPNSSSIYLPSDSSTHSGADLVYSNQVGFTAKYETENFTIKMWIKVSLDNMGIFLHLYNNQAANYGLYLRREDSAYGADGNKILLLCCTNQNNLVFAHSAAVATNGTWVFLVLTRTFANSIYTYRLYLNGSDTPSASIDGWVIPGLNSINIGSSAAGIIANSYNAAYDFSGYVADFRMYNNIISLTKPTNIDDLTI